MNPIDGNATKSEDAGTGARDDYAAPELRLVGKVSELAQAGAGAADLDGADYS